MPKYLRQLNKFTESKNMKILIPIDVWQEDTNAHLVQDLKYMLSLSKSDIILTYAIQGAPHMEKIAQVAAIGSAINAAEGANVLPIAPQRQNISKTDTYDSDRFYSDMEKKARKHLELTAKELKQNCANIEIVFEHGSPVKVINSIAQSKKVDLTVIRASSVGLLESVFLGNTVSQVIKHSENSVLILRSGPIAHDLSKVIIALDGSDQSKTALRQFCNIYKAMQGHIEVVLAHVVSIPGPWRFVSPVEIIATLEDNLDMAGKAILAEGEKILQDCGWKELPVPMIVRTGDPAVELDRLTAEVGAGLIVLGAQGKNAMQSFLLGSVSEALALKSGFPILVFK